MNDENKAGNQNLKRLKIEIDDWMIEKPLQLIHKYVWFIKKKRSEESFT